VDKYIVNEDFQSLTDKTITDKDALIAQLGVIKREGYAVDDKESQREVVCVGASIEKYQHVFGAFSVSIPEYRLDAELMEDIRRLVLTTKQQIEAIL